MKATDFATSRATILLTAGLFVISCSTNTPEQAKPEAPVFSASGKKAYVFTTADSAGVRLSATDTLLFAEQSQPVERETFVYVNPARRYQSLLGIGGAITDASAETFSRLSPDRQAELLKAYYDPSSGIGYSLARTHINSCDFSSSSYTYVQEGDSALATFDIAHDRKSRIPLIKRAIETAGGVLPLYVSPWSPPAWMKDNNDMLHGGKLLPQFAHSWAQYYVKFIQAYEAEQIPVWGLTVQNEPMATQRWESCIFTAEDEANFIKNHLGPTLQKAGMQDKKLIAWDHNRDLVYHRASEIMKDPEVARYIWGFGFHWYEDWSGGQQMFSNVGLVKEAWPEKNLLFTEGCNFPFSMQHVYDWNLGERYGQSMIEDFNAGASGWTDWNILLDDTGGPNHAENFCFAPIHADMSTGELIYTNAYYYIGHFSKFIRPGAKRLQSAPSRSNLLSTSFENENGELVAVVMNKGDRSVEYSLIVGSQSVKTLALPHSIATFVVR